MGSVTVGKMKILRKGILGLKEEDEGFFFPFLHFIEVNFQLFYFH